VATVDRRNFLRGAAAGGATAAFGTMPAASAIAAGNSKDKSKDDCETPTRAYEVPPSTLPSNPADCPIENIGVLMMENRSYDTYFGWLENGRGFQALDLDISYVDPDDPSNVGRPTHWAPKYRRCAHPDPGHGWGAGRDELQNGFLAGSNDEYALAYYLAEDIPTFAQLARQFTVFDNYFCAVLGPTYPNRWYQHAATSMGLKSNLFPPEAGSPAGFDWLTIWDRLEAAGIDWRYYFVDLPFTAMWGPRLLHRTRPIAEYFADAESGTLPKVFFVDPGFLGDHRTDDHPSSADMRTSQTFVNNIVRSFITSSSWERGAFFINYDEWGGFFDHVKPPRVPDDRASEDNLEEDFGQLGFRIPALAISPYSRKGYVHYDGPYQHGSILKFIEYRYGLEPLTTRDKESKNIGEAFDYTQAPRLEYGIEQMETPTLFFSSGCGAEGEGMDDFQRLAASGYIESVGYTVGRPQWDELFGNAPKRIVVPG
jgi:phospholipase C